MDQAKGNEPSGSPVVGQHAELFVAIVHFSRIVYSLDVYGF
jgi:hypothetical protein